MSTANLYALECSNTNVAGVTSHTFEALWWDPKSNTEPSSIARPNAAISGFPGNNAMFYFNAYEGCSFNISSSAHFWTTGVVGNASMR
ncbi:UNVERIFIED_CONTAM: hypothetical protein HDU68_005654, partial [Siphonaria sp. JEL0065]